MPTHFSLDEAHASMQDVTFWVWSIVMLVPELACPQWMSNVDFEGVVYVLSLGQSRLTGSMRVIVAECKMPCFEPGVESVPSGYPVLGIQLA